MIRFIRRVIWLSDLILHEKISNYYSDMLIDVPTDVPPYITDNIAHDLRRYQKQAFLQFQFTQESSYADLSYRHQLFHMATGSGKTLVMVATMLYLYQSKNYNKFIFFADSDAIVKKTYDNMINKASSKYLFNKSGVVIDGNNIEIKVVDTFPREDAPHTIYVKLTSIQKIHSDLTNPRENSVTYEDLEEFNIVMLADEAHHYFADSKKKRLSNAELRARSWEQTIEKILGLNNNNRLLGFSATFDLANETLYHKLRDKIVYQYDLKQFMEDKYSKNVVLLRANEEDDNKMLHGILLSQYRKYIAKDNGMHIKPVIMFKSNTIKMSELAYQELKNILLKLTPERLAEVIKHGALIYQNEQSVWHKMFSYYESLNLTDVVVDLQWDFADGNILNVNSQAFLSEDNTLRLNTLEEVNNPIRAIFQIAKLNEGWDVLNLFDIVRISEGASITRNTTNSEAQLIGRGARYYPFELDGEKSYKRRFDKIPTDLKVLETLHYHTINENKYIDNLQKSLDAAKIKIFDDGFDVLEARIKSSFKNHEIFKTGHIYINEVVSTSAKDYQDLASYAAEANYDVNYTDAIQQDYLTGGISKGSNKKETVTWIVEQKYKQKATQRNPFYYFSNLSKYVPAISTMQTFLNDKKFLGELKLHITLPLEMTLADLKPEEKLKLVERYFVRLERLIRNNFMKQQGTPVFKGVRFNELIKDYHIEMNKIQGKVTSTADIPREVPMRKKDWYIYDRAVVNSLESDLLDFIDGYVEKLKTKYNEVYLVRNERQVKIVEIDGIRGFMPDFLLYLKDESFTYQIFIEPKGEHLVDVDMWKQDFLRKISKHEDIHVLDENENVRLLGLKFFRDGANNRDEFRTEFIEELL